MGNWRISANIKMAAVCLYERGLLGLEDILECVGFSCATFFQVIQLYCEMGLVKGTKPTLWSTTYTSVWRYGLYLGPRQSPPRLVLGWAAGTPWTQLLHLCSLCNNLPRAYQGWNLLQETEEDCKMKTSKLISSDTWASTVQMSWYFGMKFRRMKGYCSGIKGDVVRVRE